MNHEFEYINGCYGQWGKCNPSCQRVFLVKQDSPSKLNVNCYELRSSNCEAGQDYCPPEPIVAVQAEGVHFTWFAAIVLLFLLALLFTSLFWVTRDCVGEGRKIKRKDGVSYTPIQGTTSLEEGIVEIENTTIYDDLLATRLSKEKLHTFLHLRNIKRKEQDRYEYGWKESHKPDEGEFIYSDDSDDKRDIFERSQYSSCSQEETYSSDTN
eukprot:g1951.t1